MIKCLLATLLLITGGASALQAQGFSDTGTAIALPTDDAVYDEKTDTWYVIFKFQGSKPWTVEHAKFIIKGYRFKGREGFLADIKNVGQHYLIVGSLLSMQSIKSWIGLEVKCTKPLQYTWQDGTTLADQSFRAWAPNAGPTARRNCGNQVSRILPVYYISTDVGMRWAVAREKEDIQHMLVAFPPLPAEEEAAKEPAEKPER